MVKGRPRLHLPPGRLSRFRLPEDSDSGTRSRRAGRGASVLSARLAWGAVVLLLTGLLSWLGTGRWRAVLQWVAEARPSVAPAAPTPGDAPAAHRPPGRAPSEAPGPSPDAGAGGETDGPVTGDERASSPPRRPRPPPLRLEGRRLRRVMGSRHRPPSEAERETP